jgi:streptogramin lyase
LAASPDGTVWFTSRDANVAGRIEPDGAFRSTNVGTGPWGAREPDRVVVGTHGSAFFTEHNSLAIGLVYPYGRHQEYVDASVAARANVRESGVIAFRPQPVSALSPVPAVGGVWFAAGNRYGSILLQQTMRVYSNDTPVQSILALPDGAWLATSSALIRVNTSGVGVERIANVNIQPGGVLVADAHGSPCYLLSTTALCAVNGSARLSGALQTFARDRTDTPQIEATRAADGTTWWISTDTHAVCQLGDADHVHCSAVDVQPAAIAAMTDGSVWLLESGSDRIMQIAPAREAIENETP